MSVFLISWYGAPLDKRAFYLALYSSLFGSAVNYDYIITNSISSLLIGLRCIPNGTHANHCWANLAHASIHIKNSGKCVVRHHTVPLLVPPIALADTFILPVTLHLRQKTKMVHSSDIRMEVSLILSRQRWFTTLTCLCMFLSYSNAHCCVLVSLVMLW